MKNYIYIIFMMFVVYDNNTAQTILNGSFELFDPSYTVNFEINSDYNDYMDFSTSFSIAQYIDLFIASDTTTYYGQIILPMGCPDGEHAIGLNGSIYTLFFEDAISLDLSAPLIPDVDYHLEFYKKNQDTCLLESGCYILHDPVKLRIGVSNSPTEFGEEIYIADYPVGIDWNYDDFYFTPSSAANYLTLQVIKEEGFKFVFIDDFKLSQAAQGSVVECAQAVLDINNVNATVFSCGNFFNNFYANDYGGYQVPDELSPIPMYKHSLWIGGLNPSGGLHIAAERFRIEEGEDFWFGPVADSYDINYDETYNKVWKVNISTIDNHILNYNTTGYVTPLELTDWPAHGDVDNGEAEYLAPFVDSNSNGIYDPENGDYPEIIGDQALFMIINDTREVHSFSNGEKLGIEIHAMLYGYYCDDNSIPSLNETSFMSMKIFNRSNTEYSDLYVGTWSDFDIGSSTNDYAGCDTTLNMYYGYNDASFDTTLTENIYGFSPPALGFKLLNGSYSSIISQKNSTNQIFGEPYNASHFYNYLRSIWLDGTPLTYGGDGYGGMQPTKFMYPSAPSDAEGWSLYQEGTFSSDYRSIGSAGPYDFPPGGVIEFDYAIIYARDETFDHIQNVDLLLENAVFIQDVYDEVILNNCLTSQVDDYDYFNDIIYPNPSSNAITVDSKKLGQLQIYNILGELVYERSKQTESMTINISDLESGVYILKLGNTATRFVKE